MNTAPTAVAAAPAPALSSAPAQPKHFVHAVQDAQKSTSWAQMMIGNDWYGPGDTTVAMDATRGALASIEAALAATRAPSGHVTPPSALAAARDGQAFLSKAFVIMHAEDHAPPVEARTFLSAAQDSFNTALREYSAKLEPTPPYV